MRGQEYWESVALLREQYAQEQADAIIRQIERLYEEAADEISAEIKKILKAFSETANLDAETAEEYISKAQQDQSVRELRKLFAQTDDPEQQADLISRINAQAYGARMTRLEAVQEAVYTAVKKAAVTEQRKLGGLLENVYADTYYQTLYDIGQGVDAGIDFAVVSGRQILEVVERPWYGKTFSERVWQNTDFLAVKAGEIIRKGITTGANVYTMAKQLEPLTNYGKYASVRLVRTETNYICNQAQKEAYASAGIEQYKFIATLDYRTCEVCGPLDGRVFYCSEATPGVNYPTMHPNCRCTTTIPTAYLSRWANDGEHKYKTDGDVTFAQWKENMTPEQRTAFETHVKQWKNRSADKKQYARYVERLGRENMPKTFDLFQDLKYTDIDVWNNYQKVYKTAEGYIVGGLNLDTGKQRQIVVVNHVALRGIPNSVTQISGKKGGIERNYYGHDGRQKTQIANNDHSKPKQHPYGERGEHAHDYVWKSETEFDRSIRELLDFERKENYDIL